MRARIIGAIRRQNFLELEQKAISKWAVPICTVTNWRGHGLEQRSQSDIAPMRIGPRIGPEELWAEDRRDLAPGSANRGATPDLYMN